MANELSRLEEAMYRSEAAIHRLTDALPWKEYLLFSVEDKGESSYVYCKITRSPQNPKFCPICMTAVEKP